MADIKLSDGLPPIVRLTEFSYRIPGMAITPAEAAKHYHRPVHYKTVLRHMNGFRGLRLFSVRNGRGRCTWKEDVFAFLAALDAQENARQQVTAASSIKETSRNTDGSLAKAGI